RFQIREVGMSHLPTNGPVILATNCHDLTSSLELVSVTDRTTIIVLFNGDPADSDGTLRTLALTTSLVEMPAAESSPEVWAKATAEAHAALEHGHLLALGLDGAPAAGAIERFLGSL